MIEPGLVMYRSRFCFDGTLYLHNSNIVGLADLIPALGIPDDMPILTKSRNH
jgi:hypothetical protein